MQYAPLTTEAVHTPSAGAATTTSGDPAERARAHFRRAVELSGGADASPYVTLAEAVCVPAQDAGEFSSLLGKALAIDADAHPEIRLSNLVMQRRARWLLARRDNLILPPPDAPAAGTDVPHP